MLEAFLLLTSLLQTVADCTQMVHTVSGTAAGAVAVQGAEMTLDVRVFQTDSLAVACFCGHGGWQAVWASPLVQTNTSLSERSGAARYPCNIKW